MNIEIANRLAELRRKNNLSQEELAAKLGLSRQAVSKWERAEAAPDTTNLILLAKLYNVSLDELLSTESSEEELVQENVDQNEDKKEKTKVKITADGIHIVDDKDEVTITADAIHIVDEGDEVTIGKGRNNSDDGKSPAHRTVGLVSYLFSLIVLVAYMLLGFFVPGGWRIYWTLFLLVPVVSSLGYAIVDKNPNKFAFPVLVAFVYLFIGVFFGLWHPTWLMFLAVPIYYTIFKIFRHTKN